MALFSSSSSRSSLFSSFRAPSSSLQQQQQMEKVGQVSHRRGYHIDLGAREKALLEEDPALKRFKSYKNTVKRVSKVGNALTVLVIAACSYEIVTVAAMKKI
ncbi:succinate dehydrogenase subunit 7, mitochondrial-like [Iris pallida]|uniref:Succinate dehydrogenase subunit 7, mitochondrial-like n=1 Tax=Iris pallida TaxID=29817 RepID=A0AAX6I0Y4_IRIPA|nr:succinate dehydrogenase subunit 7, mitochondrial-like [Iris pallida]KAJ6846447.1 succinate dehydrogenase subunit 7, mitochondrial-like [Iris pallida]